MDRQHLGLYRFVAVVALVAGGCASSAPASMPMPTTTARAAAAIPGSSSPAPSLILETKTPVPSATTIPTASPTPTATKKPTATTAKQPVSTPAPTPPKLAAGWTAPHRIGKASACVTVTAAIDAASRYHIAAECDGAIHYYSSIDLGSLVEGAGLCASSRTGGSRSEDRRRWRHRLRGVHSHHPGRRVRRRARPERRCLLPLTSLARRSMVGREEDRACGRRHRVLPGPRGDPPRDRHRP